MITKNGVNMGKQHQVRCYPADFLEDISALDSIMSGLPHIYMKMETSKSGLMEPKEAL